MSEERTYKCLTKNSFTEGEYTLIPLRDEDKWSIRQWRNEQIDILRQKKPLSEQEQADYFANVVTPLFEAKNPKQLLFSFLKNNELIGYGGLVHVNWEDKNAEISFLLETTRNSDIQLFSAEWSVYLTMLKTIAFKELEFKKIYTYAYDIRPYLIEIIEKNGFQQEAKLKSHVFIQNKWVDVLIHSLIVND